MSRYFLMLLVVYTAILESHSQNILKPNYAKASHPLEVKQITRTADNFILELVLTNQVDGGYFCADKLVSITNSGALLKANLIHSEGIPTCPDVHRFSKVGELLNFKLLFPSVSKELVYIDLKENCNDNCFEIQGIVLDPSLNTQIDLAHHYFEEGKFDMAILIYRKIVLERTDYPFAISYFNLIHFLVQKQNFAEAKQWYQKLQITHYRDTQMTLNRLKNMPYYSQLL